MLFNYVYNLLYENKGVEQDQMWEETNGGIDIEVSHAARERKLGYALNKDNPQMKTTGLIQLVPDKLTLLMYLMMVLLLGLLNIIQLLMEIPKVVGFQMILGILIMHII